MVFAGLCNAQTMYMGPVQLYRLNLIFWIVMGCDMAHLGFIQLQGYTQGILHIGVVAFRAVTARQGS